MTKDQIEQKIAELHEKMFSLQKDIEEVERESVKMNDVEEWPNIGREYWIVTAGGEPASSHWDNDSCDNLRIRIGNVFRTEQDAKFAAERLKVLAEMRKFAFEPDWNNDYQRKIIICYCDNKITTETFTDSNYGLPVFDSVKTANDCIDVIGEKRLKKYYFGVKYD